MLHLVQNIPMADMNELKYEYICILFGFQKARKFETFSRPCWFKQRVLDRCIYIVIQFNNS